MKETTAILWILLMSWAVLRAQDARIAPTKTPLSEVERLKMPPLNNDSLRSAELSRRRPGRAPRFAESMEVAVTPTTHGTWERITPAEAVWRLRILSAGAQSLNLGFARYHLPAGSSLILYTPDRKRVMGPFTAADNEDHAQLWTPVFDGDELVLELRIPIAKREEVDLLLSSINHDFLGFNRLLSGECQLDINCGSADGWGIVDRYRDIIRSVGIFGLGGNTFCTGFLINNTREDCTPYFMTANHCQINTRNAPSVTVYWNFENSYCRQPGNAGGRGDGTLDDYNLGARYLAGWAPSDFTLLELDDPVSSSAEAFFAGWSAGPEMSSDTLSCIHHPSGGEKRIAFSFRTTYLGAWGQGDRPVAEGNHLVLPFWDIGTTEVGSSGAPLFNRQGRVVGQLHGGLADCDNQEYDLFGWFHRSWEGGGTPATSLRPWLDPDSTRLLQIDGHRNRNCNYFIDASVTEQAVCAPDTAAFSLLVSPQFKDSIVLEVTGLPENAVGQFFPNPVVPGDSAVLVIHNTGQAPDGTYPLQIHAIGDPVTVTTHVSFILSGDQPAAPVLKTPVDGASQVSTFTSLSWHPPATAIKYQVQLAEDPGFDNIILERRNLPQPFYQLPLLQPEQDYYWRVRTVNACGESSWSVPARFQTARTECLRRPAGDLPINISDRGSPTVQSVRIVEEEGTVVGVTLKDLNIQHTYVGDLIATLTSPSGRTITLFDQLGRPAQSFGCDGQDLLLSFSDEAARSAEELENSCENQPAAQGAFRPQDPLAAFLGERAEGPWMLTVEDKNNQDGGALLSWTLELCIARPPDRRLAPGAFSYVSCPETPLDMELIVGAGFNQNGVALTASGQPTHTEVRFNRNPVFPGDTVGITLLNLRESDRFPLSIAGSDGIDTTTLTIDIRTRAVPKASHLLAPADEARNLPLQTLLRWRAAGHTDDYLLQVATDSAFQELFFERSVRDTFFIMGGLDYQTTYYWRVLSRNQCPTTVPSPVFVFTTLRDAGLTVSTSEIDVCAQEAPAFQFLLGSGFEAPQLQFRVSPPVPLQIEFDRDTARLSGGDLVRAHLQNLIDLQAGTYLIELLITEDSLVVSETIRLLLSTAPAVPRLLEPGNNLQLGSNSPQLRWQGSPGADHYRLEISLDDSFGNDTRRFTTQDTTYSPEEPLEAGIYFWRVTARNKCGNATTSSRSFQIGSTGREQWPASALRFYPNPAADVLFIAFEKALPDPVLFELFNPAGQLLEQRYLSDSTLQRIDLSGRPGGLYSIRLTSSKETISRRIIHLNRE